MHDSQLIMCVACTRRSHMRIKLSCSSSFIKVETLPWGESNHKVAEEKLHKHGFTLLRNSLETVRLPKR